MPDTTATVITHPIEVFAQTTPSVNVSAHVTSGLAPRVCTTPNINVTVNNSPYFVGGGGSSPTGNFYPLDSNPSGYLQTGNVSTILNDGIEGVKLNASLVNVEINGVIKGTSSAVQTWDIDSSSGEAVFRTISNTAIHPRIVFFSDPESVTIDVNNTDVVDIFPGQLFSIDGISGTPYDCQKILVRIIGDGGNYPITWGAVFAPGGVDLPNAAVDNKQIMVGLIYNSSKGLFMCIAVATEA